MSVLAFCGEDGEDFYGFRAVGADGVGDHGGELGGVALLDDDQALTEAEGGGAGAAGGPTGTAHKVRNPVRQLG